MANTFKFGNGKWAVKDGSALAYNDENGNFKPLPFDFTRSTSATRVNKDGLIEIVGSGEPRIDFLNDSNGALLLEPSRSNIFTDSENISTWTNSVPLTRTYNIAVAPDGQTTADGIQDETGVSFKNVYKQFSVSGNSTMTGSVFVKKVASETNYMGVFLLFTGVTNKVAYGIINSVTGTIVAADSTITPTFKVEDYGDYWRFAITATDNGSNTLCRFGVYGCLSTNGTSIGVGVSSLRTIWGAQLEAGSYPTSYIPTQGSAVTVVAESCSDAGNNQVINSTEGVLYIETSALANDLSERRFGISDGTSSNVVRVGYTNFSNRIIAVVYNGSNQAVLTYTSSDITQKHKIAVKYKENDFALWVNGVERSTDVSGSVFSANTLNSLDFNIGGANHFYSDTKEVKIYNTALSDAELATLTTI